MIFINDRFAGWGEKVAGRDVSCVNSEKIMLINVIKEKFIF